jgi:hypothetical protein
MDPKELAQLFEEKNADKAAKTAQEKAQLEAQRAERQKRTEAGRVALRDVVIPYFKKLVATFPKGQFSFDPAALMDSETHTSVAVSFKIGDGAEHCIEVIQGNVRIWRQGPKFPGQGGKRPKVPKGRKPPGQLPGMSIQFVYSGNAEPFIAVPSDLTPEKLGKLVEMAIREG